MKKIILLIFLVSCGSEHQPKVTWSGNITEQSDLFILSYFDPIALPQLENVEHWWSLTQECTGISIDISNNPLIIEYLDDGISSQFDGYIVWSNSYTRIRYWSMNDEALHKHEMIHYLLFLIGENDKDNKNHKSSWFTDCT